MRTKTKRFILGGTAVVAMAAAALVFATAGSGSTPGPMSAAQIKSLVTTDAAEAGDNTPTDISYSALVTRNQANAVSSGAWIGPPYGSATGFYLVVAHGNFTATDAPIPNGVAVPTGTVMTLVVNATTGEVTDSGIGNTTPDMSTLGPVTTIASG
jgi:hypothetical protein